MSKIKTAKEGDASQGSGEATPQAECSTLLKQGWNLGFPRTLK